MKKETVKIQWVVALGAAFAWFGQHCGSGFFSGLQMVKYFTNAGWLSLFTTLFPFVVLGFVFYYMGEYARLIRAESYKDVAETLYSKNKVVGRVMVTFFDLIIMGSVLITSSTTLAGAGTLLNQAFGMNYLLATILFTGVIVVISMFGATMLAKINLPLGTVMTGTIVIVAAVLISNNWGGLVTVVKSRDTFGVSTGTAISNMLYYTGLQTGFCGAFIAIAGKFTSKKDNMVVAIFGAFINCFLLFLVSLAILSRMPGVASSLIPLYDMVNQLSSSGVLSALYTFGLFLAYVSTADVVAATSRFGVLINRKKRHNQVVVDAILGIVLLSISLAFAQLGIAALVDGGYKFLSLLRGPIYIIGGLIFAPWRIRQIKKQIKENGESVLQINAPESEVTVS